MTRYKLSVLDFINYGSSPSFDALLELSGSYNGETINPLNATDKVKEMYSTWKTEKLPNLLRAFSALQAEYNPLDNYNGYEKTDITYGKTTDTEYGKTDTTTHGKTNTLETDVYGYNSGENGADSDKVTSTDGGTTEIVYGGTDGIKEGGTETHEVTKRGNLGVTTNFQMISGEWDLRARNYVIDVLRDFINIYTAY